MSWSLFKLRPSVFWARWTGFLRRRYYLKNGLRPASWPFVSGDSYRALAKHVWDEKDQPPFKIDDIQENDIVFVSWYIGAFLHYWAPRILVPFYLISSNSDQPIGTSEVEAFSRTKGSHWWAANLTVRSDLVTPIPLGLQNENLCWVGDVQDFLRVRKLSQTVVKQNKICWGFTVGTNAAARGPIRDALRQNPMAVELPSMDPYSYRRELIKYKYVASPPGNGPDCHRTWEALALGVIPVVLSTEMNRQLRDNGFELVLLESPENFATFILNIKENNS